MNVPHEKHVLDNGLEVLLHADPSDPLVAVHLTYHVGSSREPAGRTGFAHLFEHMLFQGSENVPEGEFFRRIQQAGGVLNGSTNQDRTNYYEVLPADALELALFLEADRMGRLLPAMTQAKLDNQRDVVKNERRQSYDNRPYGRVHETILGELYPDGHPYQWPTIGSMEDIDRATLEDVAAFFSRWYGPNNASLAIGGAIEPREALALVERHFGALAPCPPVDRPGARPARLEEDVRHIHEDRVRQPQLSLVWPTCAAWHPDEPALNLSADALSANKASLLDRVLMTEERLASHVTIWHHAGERAGFLRIDLRPADGVELSALEARLDELVTGFANEAFDSERLERLKARREGALLRSLETVAARTALLSHTNCFHGRGDLLRADVERHRAVTSEALLVAARRYLVGRPRITLSTVPHGQRELAAALERAPVARTAPPSRPETPADGRAASEAGGSEGATGAPGAAGPVVAHGRVAGGVPLLAAHFDGVPFARFALCLNGGRLREAPGQAGLASFCAELLDEGTAHRDGSQWTDALDGLGATFGASAGNDDLLLSIGAPEEHFDAALELLGELLREPRFAEDDVARAREMRLVRIGTLADRAGELADEVFRAVVHTADQSERGGAMAAPRLGTQSGMGALGADDVRAFYRTGVAALGARCAYVGPRSSEALSERLQSWSSWWDDGEQRTASDALQLDPRPGRRITLVAKPGAPQAELRVGHPGIARTHPDFEALGVVNHVFGGGFTSRLNRNLREEKGYTYGVRSSVVGGRSPGRFCVATAVDTPNAVAALQEILIELERLVASGLQDDELAFAKDALSRSLALAYESTGAKLGLLQRMGAYGLPDDYVGARARFLARLERGPLDTLAQGFFRPEALDLVVVGDPEVLLPGLEALGETQVLDPDVAAGAREE